MTRFFRYKSNLNFLKELNYVNRSRLTLFFLDLRKPHPSESVFYESR